ncbi:MAG: hypothetical protein HC921_10165 [Synechococcaceae cyanobacterium SM2_3_1]|nr:hypothetical protein [Synechococcaceae cyanobacterium SM2_3_1]
MALSQGDLQQSLTYLGWALEQTAGDPEHEALLEQIIQSVEDPLDLVPLQNPMSHVQAALLAYILAGEREYEDAFDLLLQALQVQPESAFSHWAIRWLQVPAAQAAIQPQHVMHLALSLLRDPPHSHAFARLAPFFLEYIHTHPEDWVILGMVGALLQPAGRSEEALPLALRALEHTPHWQTAHQVALIYADLQNIEQAIHYQQQAVELAPEQDEPLQDLALLLWEHGKLEELTTLEERYPHARQRIRDARDRLTGHSQQFKTNFSTPDKSW